MHGKRHASALSAVADMESDGAWLWLLFVRWHAVCSWLTRDWCCWHVFVFVVLSFLYVNEEYYDKFIPENLIILISIRGIMNNQLCIRKDIKNFP